MIGAGHDLRLPAQACRGRVLLEHVALSRLRWVAGDTQTVLDALLEVLGPTGTLVVPAFSSQLTDPAAWEAPPVPASWVEPIRDAMLSVTGKLQLQMGGPASHDLAIPRRTLYLQTARWDRSNFASLFDGANPDASTDKRNVSTVALQSLFLMNHPFVLMQARNFGERLQHELPDRGADAEAARIQRAYLLALQRLPSDEELAIARELVAGSQWHDLAHVLLCSNEFIYID